MEGSERPVADRDLAQVRQILGFIGVVLTLGVAVLTTYVVATWLTTTEEVESFGEAWGFGALGGGAVLALGFILYAVLVSKD